MNFLKSYFPPGLFRKIWHSLLLITALFAAVFTILDLVHMMFSAGRFPITVLLLMLGLVGFSLLAIFCIWKAAGCVRYWALFLWLGLFLLFATTASFLPSSEASSFMNYQLFHFLASILLFVFFWNLGRFNWRIGVPLLLLCLAFFGMVLYSEVSSHQHHLVYTDVIERTVLVCFPVFMTIYYLSVFLALSAKDLPGFGWLIVGFSLPLLAVLLFFVPILLSLESSGDSGLAFVPFMLIIIVTYPILLTVGASLFTLKMDPSKLEERLRKATPDKEVESADQKI
jgi:hypothetical protein